MNARDILSPEVKDFMNRLTLMKVEAGKLGLYKTMHALETPIKEVGWEIADKVDKAMKGIV